MRKYSDRFKLRRVRLRGRGKGGGALLTGRNALSPLPFLSIFILKSKEKVLRNDVGKIIMMLGEIIMI